MLSFVYLPTPITFGYLFGYSKDHILASYSNATFKEIKKEIRGYSFTYIKRNTKLLILVFLKEGL